MELVRMAPENNWNTLVIRMWSSRVRIDFQPKTKLKRTFTKSAAQR